MSELRPGAPGGGVLVLPRPAVKSGAAEVLAVEDVASDLASLGLPASDLSVDGVLRRAREVRGSREVRAVSARRAPENALEAWEQDEEETRLSGQLRREVFGNKRAIALELAEARNAEALRNERAAKAHRPRLVPRDADLVKELARDKYKALEDLAVLETRHAEEKAQRRASQRLGRRLEELVSGLKVEVVELTRVVESFREREEVARMRVVEATVKRLQRQAMARSFATWKEERHRTASGKLVAARREVHAAVREMRSMERERKEAVVLAERMQHEATESKAQSARLRARVMELEDAIEAKEQEDHEAMLLKLGYVHGEGGKGEGAAEQTAGERKAMELGNALHSKTGYWSKWAAFGAWRVLAMTSGTQVLRDAMGMLEHEKARLSKEAARVKQRVLSRAATVLQSGVPVRVVFSAWKRALEDTQAEAIERKLDELNSELERRAKRALAVEEERKAMDAEIRRMELQRFLLVERGVERSLSTKAFANLRENAVSARLRRKSEELKVRGEDAVAERQRYRNQLEESRQAEGAWRGEVGTLKEQAERTLGVMDRVLDLAFTVRRKALRDSAFLRWAELVLGMRAEDGSSSGWGGRATSDTSSAKGAAGEPRATTSGRGKGRTAQEPATSAPAAHQARPVAGPGANKAAAAKHKAPVSAARSTKPGHSPAGTNHAVAKPSRPGHPAPAAKAPSGGRKAAGKEHPLSERNGRPPQSKRDDLGQESLAEIESILDAPDSLPAYRKIRAEVPGRAGKKNVNKLRA